MTDRALDRLRPRRYPCGRIRMEMAMRIMASLAVAVAIVSAAPALAAGCGENRDACEAICTPERIAHYHAGVAARCSASCEPRFQQCLRTGVWMHLEDRYAGWAEPVDRR